MSTSAQQITHISNYPRPFFGDLQELLARAGTHVEMARLRRAAATARLPGPTLSAQILFADDNAEMKDYIRGSRSSTKSKSWGTDKPLWRPSWFWRT
jgi:hypothetical protein